MHPVLINFKIPVWMAQYFGPSSLVFANWKLLAGVFAACFLLFMWLSEPPTYDESQPPKKNSTALLWLTGLIALVLALLLGGVGLVKLGRIRLHTYGVLVSTAFLIGIMLSIREAKRTGENPDNILDLAFWVILAAIVGSRVLFIITEWNLYAADWQKIHHWTQWRLFRIWEGGLVFYGGFLGAMLASWWFMHRHKMNFWKITDIIVPTLAIGHFFGRLGCFSAGCCYGKSCSVSWGVTFHQGFATKGIPIHPTQLYSALGALTVFFLLVWLRSHKRYHGQILAWYLLLYPISRFTVEIFRGDAERGYLFKWDAFPQIIGPDLLTTSQFVSIILFFIGLSIMAFRNKQIKSTSSLPT